MLPTVGPITSASLQRLKARKREIASHAAPTKASVQDTALPSEKAKLKAHQIEIDQLKKERDSMEDRLKRLEDVLKQQTEGSNSSNPFKEIKERLGALETLIMPEKGEVYTPKLISKRVTDLQTNNAKKFEELEAAIEPVEQVQGRLDQLAEQSQAIKEDVDLLKSWKEQQSNAINRVAAKVESATKTLREESTTTESQLKKRIDEIHDSLTTCLTFKAATEKQDFHQQINKLDNEVGVLRESLVKASKLTFWLNETCEQNTTNLTALDQRTQKVEDLSTRIAQLESGLPAVETQVAAFESRLAAIESRASAAPDTQIHSPEGARQTQEIDDLWGNVERVNAQVNTIEERVQENSNAITVLRDRVPELFRNKFDALQQSVDQQQQGVNGTLEAQDTIIADLGKSVTSLQRDLTLLNQGIATHNQEIKQIGDQLASKADNTSTNKQMDTFRLTIRSLSDQYNDITTEDLHQRMVYWFLQMFPSNATQMLQQYASLKEDVAELKARIELEARNTQIAWIQDHSQDLAMILEKAPQIQALGNSRDDVQANKHKAEVEEALTEAKTTGDANSKHIKDMQQTLAQVQTNLATLTTTYIEGNEKFLPYLGAAFAVITQLQQITESLNVYMKKPQGHIHWCLDFNALVEAKELETPDQPHTNGDGARDNRRVNGNSEQNVTASRKTTPRDEHLLRKR